MRLSVEIGEKHFLVLVGVLAVVSAVGIVTGYGGSNPSTVGHTLGELEPGTFGAGDYIFPDNLDVGGNLGVSGSMDIGGGLGVSGDMDASGTVCGSSGCIGEKVSSPACTFCKSCGGNWPSYQGTLVDYANIARYRGNECSGDLAQHTDTNTAQLCCK